MPSLLLQVACRRLVNGFNQATQDIGRCGCKDAMSKIEDMSGTLSCAPQDIVHALLDRIPGCQQERGIGVTLDATIISDTRPGIVKVDAPINAHNTSPCLSHQF